MKELRQKQIKQLDELLDNIDKSYTIVSELLQSKTSGMLTDKANELFAKYQEEFSDVLYECSMKLACLSYKFKHEK